MAPASHKEREVSASGLTAAARTHAGKVRTSNQDAFICEPEGGTFAVIDGMGGAQAGEIAAELTRRKVLEILASGGEPSDALDRANEAVFRRAAENPEESGMGCVATLASVEDATLQIAHVGDTRAFLASRTGCEQLTRDHTVVADLQEQHAMTSAAADSLKGRHQITRDIGGSLHSDLSWIDSARTRFDVGDVLLLCSDGLSDLVSDSDLFRLLSQARKEGQEVLRLVNRLIELALERGAHDNVTVVVVRRDQLPSSLGNDAATVEHESEPPTEEVRAIDPFQSARVRKKPMGIFFGALAAVTAIFAIGWSLSTWWPKPLIPVDGRRGLVAMAQKTGAHVLAPGEAGLDGLIGHKVTISAIGPLKVSASRSRTEISDGAEVTIRGAQLFFPDGPVSWEIRLGAASQLRLRQASIRAPELRIDVTFAGEGGRLVLEDSHLDIAFLSGRGLASTRVEIRGGVLYQRHQATASGLEGPTFIGAVSADPPDYGPEEIQAP